MDNDKQQKRLNIKGLFFAIDESECHYQNVNDFLQLEKSVFNKMFSEVYGNLQ